MSKIAITHAKLIEMAKDGKVSCPTNGSEGMYFTALWCDECKKEQNYDPDTGTGGCPMIVLEMADEPTGRWRSVPNGKYKGRLVCLDFIDKDTPDEPYRCDKTIDISTARSFRGRGRSERQND